MTGVRSGPLGDGTPITANDAELTLQYLDSFASTLNLTEGEKEVFEALSQDKESLIEMLNSIRGRVESAKDNKAEVVEAGNAGKERFVHSTESKLFGFPAVQIVLMIFLFILQTSAKTKRPKSERAWRGNQHQRMTTSLKTASLTS